MATTFEHNDGNVEANIIFHYDKKLSDGQKLTFQEIIVATT